MIKEPEKEMSLAQDILTYAFRGSGKYVLGFVVVLSVISVMIRFAPVVGGIASILVSAYFCAVFYNLINSSAIGDDEAPMFPEVEEIFRDMIFPLLQIILIFCLSFGPLIGYSIWAGEDGIDLKIEIALAISGILYAPMALLAVVVLSDTFAMSPHVVIPSIFRAGWLYWIAVALLVGLYFLEFFLAEMFSGSWIVGTIVISLVGGITMMTNARILGLIYRVRGEELNWA